MAGMWRIVLEEVRELGNKTPSAQSVLGAINALAADLRSEEGGDVVGAKNVVFELACGSTAQRSKPIEVPHTGTAVLNRIFFINKLSAAEEVVVRVFRQERLARSEGSGLIGEGAFASKLGRYEVQLFRRGKQRGVVIAAVQDGLPAPSPNSPQRFPSSAQQTVATASSPISTASGGTAARGVLVPPVTGPRRQLRRRMQTMGKLLGNCDLTVENVQGLMPPLQRPYLIVGLEGQEEFLADRMGRDALHFTFQLANVRSNLQIYCYDDASSSPAPVGRILIPVTDVLWPAGKRPQLARLTGGLDKAVFAYKRHYHLQFLPASSKGDGQGNPFFADRFTPAFCEAGTAKAGAFGQVSVIVEVTLAPNTSLLSLYAASMAEGVNRVKEQPRPSWSLVQSATPIQNPVVNPLPRDEAGIPAEIWNLLTDLARLQHWCQQPSRGFVRWLREEPTHAYAAASAWFVFCWLGFFPCSLWISPLYAWLAFTGNGLLAAWQRETDWDLQSGQARALFWKEAEEVPMEPKAGSVPPVDKPARMDARLRVVVPLVHTLTTFIERMCSALTFADPAGSIAFFIFAGALALLLCLSLMLLEYIDPGLYFICGTYGAVGIVAASRVGRSASKPLEAQRTFNEVFSCVPDEAEVVHRFVATRVQCLDSERVIAV